MKIWDKFGLLESLIHGLIVTVEMAGEKVRNKDQKALTNNDLARLLA